VSKLRAQYGCTDKYLNYT